MLKYSRLYQLAFLQKDLFLFQSTGLALIWSSSDYLLVHYIVAPVSDIVLHFHLVRQTMKLVVNLQTTWRPFFHAAIPRPMSNALIQPNKFTTFKLSNQLRALLTTLNWIKQKIQNRWRNSIEALSRVSFQKPNVKSNFDIFRLNIKSTPLFYVICKNLVYLCAHALILKLSTVPTSVLSSRDYYWTLPNR